MAKLKLLSTIFSKLGSLTKNNGQIIVSRDSKSLYVDLDDERIEITDWIDINTEENLLAILTPLTNKYYYTKDSNKIWRYIGGEWICVNVNVNELTPTYAESTSLVKLSSGEKLSVAFGKISKAITDLISHIGDSTKHITSTERTNWNSAKTHADSAHAPADAQKNVQSDWSATSGDAYIKNKPTEFPPSIHTHIKSEISDFPSSLPANGGNADTVNNHTVETDVPTDAVFTDTVYDDTEVKGSIEEVNSNLDTLAYGENTGGKNLIFTDALVGKKLSITQDIGGIAPNGDTITFSISTTTNDDMDNSKSVLYIMRTDGTNSTPVNNGQTLTLTDDDKNNFLGYRVNVIPSLEGKIVKSIQVEVGTTATPYEPYIPSVKMLAEEVNQQNESLESQGLNNKFDGILFQGFFDTNGTEGNPTQSNTCVVSKNPINVSDGDIINVKYSGKETTILFAQFYKSDGSNNGIVMMENGSNIDSTFAVRADSKTMHINIGNSNGISINDVSSLYVGVNNEIAELSSNLKQLEFGEIAGGKNLFNGKYIQSVLTSDVDYTNRNLYNEFPSVSDITGLKYLIFGRYFKKGTYTFSYSNNNFLSLNRTAIAGSSCVVSANVIRKSYTWTQDVDGYTYFTIEADESETSTTDILFKGTPDIQIEEGSVATEYEPYFPSNKMLAEENAQQNIEAMDLKMLGWTVPSECPVQNYVDSDGVFHQRVGRVDLGSLNLTYVSGTNSRFACSSLLPVAKYIDNDAFANAYCTKYIVDTANNIYKHVKDKTIHVSKSSVWIYDTTYTDATIFNTAMKGVYLYYELETEITKTIDGNEAVEELSSNLDELSYSDNGIENLCNPNKIERGLYTSTDTRGENYFHYEIEVTPNEYYSRTRFDGLTDYSGYCFSVLDENKNCIVVFANNERTIQIPSNGAYLWLQGGESAEQLKNMKYMVVKLQTPPTDYKPYIPSVKTLADEVSAQNESLSDLENAINGLNDDNYWEQGTWNILGQKVDEPTIIRMKEKLILPIDYSVSLVNSNYVYEVDYYENGAYKNDTDWISGSIVIPNGQEFALLIRKVDNSDLVPTERNAISVLPKNIGTINDKLKNDLGGLSFSASGTTLTITDGTNTWTLEANS